MALLELKDVHTYYGAVHALRGVSLKVEEGEIVTLIGSNGAGKTTTLRTISGLERARSGSITLNGKSIEAAPAHEIVRLGVGHSPEGRRVFTRMSVRENLEMGAFLRKPGPDVQADFKKVFDLFPRLREREFQAAGTMSGGEQQMLAIGRALMGQPKVLLLDEPSMGLAPLITQQVFAAIVGINREGIGVVLAEQNARSALQIASSAYVLSEGRVVLSGPAEQLADDPAVQKAYLGV